MPDSKQDFLQEVFLVGISRKASRNMLENGRVIVRPLPKLLFLFAPLHVVSGIACLPC